MSEDSKNLKNRAIGGFFWALAEKFTAQGVSFIVSIILARLLLPEAYGIVAIVTIFTSIANVFVKSGLGTSLIQKKNADALDFSTIFYFNMAFSIVLYIAMFFFAPVIADFYGNDLISPVLRVSSITLLLSGINNVQQAYVSKHLEFRKFFWSTLIGTVVSAVVGIIMAYKGFGVWALVTQQLLNSFMDTVFLHFTIGWKPTREFSFNRLKSLYRFGWKVFAVNLMDTIYDDMQGLAIGKKYSSADLAYYNKGSQFPRIIARNIDNSIQSVTFPVLSLAQNDMEKFKKIMYRGCTLSFYFICPMMIGMLCVARPMVLLLLTENWIECVPYVQLFCISYLFRPLEVTNLQALYALGKSGLAFKLDILKKIIGIIMLVLALLLFNYPIYICIACVLCRLLNTLINMVAVQKQTSYKMLEQLKSILGTLVISLIMGGASLLMQYLLPNLRTIWLLVIQIFVGAGVYLLLSILFKLESFKYTVNYIKGLFSKHKDNEAHIN